MHVIAYCGCPADGSALALWYSHHTHNGSIQLASGHEAVLSNSLCGIQASRPFQKPHFPLLPWALLFAIFHDNTATMWYHVSEPNSYLAVTGAGIDNVIIAKKKFIMPFQKVTKLSITPFDFSMSLQAMTSEKLQFSLLAVFTIGPEDNIDSLTKYAVLLTGGSDGQIYTKRSMVATGRNHVQDIIKGVIEVGKSSECM
ncbi:hypothetical protein AC579_6199 [Pseudocercospora musae]|uniref:Uncharacterized protein n=1 Tax=Pseudocercospora musae TaxID=113226 RepID=A0A139I232_9PEZI|nr:hypothetical protein AC579_6199 [Pseudocercospora musae]